MNLNLLIIGTLILLMIIVIKIDFKKTQEVSLSLGKILKFKIAMKSERLSQKAQSKK